MAGSRRVTIQFLGDDKSASKTARSVDTTTSKLGDTFKRVGKAAAVGLGVGIAAAGTALFAFGKGAVEEAREAQKITAQTEAVIKSTGGAAKVTADQVADLAGAISMKTGIDDEAIQSGQNMLLTFTNIRNEVGKGNDIFDQSTMIMTDMSAALGQDMKSSAMQLGKALNDPIAGVSALSRVGVTFTEQTKKQIETLVKQGDTMGAQKIILKELNKEFAGSAEAQATAGDKARVAWGNFQEEIGTKLLPMMDKLAVFFVEDVVPALQRFSAWFEREAIPVIKRFADEAGEKISQFIALIKKHWPEISKTIKQVLKDVVAIVRGAVKLVMTVWNKWGDDISRVVKTHFKNVSDQIKASLKIVRGVIDVVTGIIKGDWSQVWRGIKEIFGGVWDSIKNVLRNAVEQIRNIFRSLWDGLKDIARNAFAALKDIARNGFDGLVDMIRSVPDRIRNLAGGFASAGKGLITSFIDGMRSAGDFVGGIAGGIWDALKGLINDAIDSINSSLEFEIEIPGPNPPGINPPDIPRLAKGGIVRARPGGTLAILGEGGEDEIVTPMSRVRSLAGGGVTIVINGALDPNAVAKQVQNMLVKLKRNNGGGELGIA